MIKELPILDRVERNIALILTAVIAIIQVFFAFHAGGLWRDEVNTVALATMPSISQVWENLEYDSFPLLWILFVRTFTFVGLDTDIAFRLLGCSVGLGSLAALWYNARLLGYSVPLLSLSLLGFSSTMLLWGGSMRAYGIGSLLGLLTLAMVWRLTSRLTIGRAVICAVVAIGSVQALYYNAILVFAFIISGVVVSLSNKHWRRAATLFAIGIISAVSILPYIPTVRAVRQWNEIFSTTNFTPLFFWHKLSGALAASGPFLQWVWVILAIGAIFSAVEALRRSKTKSASLYSGIALLVAASAYYIFLWVLSYPTQPWYYLALIAPAAVLIEGSMTSWAKARTWRFARIGVSLGIAFWSFLPLLGTAGIRLTNIDLVAEHLQSRSKHGDLIVVSPWYYGVTFQRYYNGNAEWITLPSLTDHAVHRYDLLKAKMESNNPIDSTLEEVAETLKSGNRVWIVGHLSYPSPETTLNILSPAPNDEVGWNEGAYLRSWSMQVGQLLQSRATRAEQLPHIGGQNVSPYENAKVVVFEGWKN